MRRALLLVAVLMLAACGGGGNNGGGSTSAQPAGPRLTKSQYEAKLKTIGKEIGDRLGNTLSATKKNSKEAIEKGAQAMREFADELARINPPAAIEQLHRDLIDGIRGFADDLPELNDQLNKAKEPSDAITILFGNPSIQKLSKAQQELKKRGYDIDFDST